MRAIRHCLFAAMWAATPAYALPKLPKAPIELPKPKPKPKPAPAPEPEPAPEPAAAEPSSPRGTRTEAASAPEPEAVAAAPIPEVPEAYRIAPVDGARKATPRAPTWCPDSFEPYKERDLEVGDLTELLDMEDVYGDRPSSNYDLAHAISRGAREVAQLACTYGERPEAQAWLAAVEQHVVNTYPLDEPSWDEVLAYSIGVDPRGGWDPDLEAAKEAGCGPFGRDELGNKDTEQLKDAHRDLLCMRHSRMGFYWAGLAWWLDRRPELQGELERAALIHRFVGDGPGLIGTEADDMRASDSERLAKWVFIRKDALAFDRAKAMEELHALELPQVARVNGAVKLAKLERQIADTDAAYQTIAGKLPELQEAFDAADKAFEDWSAGYQAHQAAIEDAYTFEQAWLSGRKSALEGCSDTLRGHFGDYARGSGPKTPEDVEALASQPVGYLLLSALYRCEADLGNEHNAGSLGRLLADSAKQRGPRTAGVVAAMGVVGLAKANFDRFPFESQRMVPWGSQPEGVVGNPAKVDWAWDAGRNYHSFANAVVKSATPEGERVKVVFRTERYEVPTYNCVETGKIDRIASDGRIIYRQNCTKTGTEWRSNTEQPITVDKSVAEGIKSGAYVRIRREGELGYPVEVYADSAKSRLVSYFGVPLE